MMTSDGIRIKGVWYSVRLTKQRQFFDGVERLCVVDHDRREIRMSSLIRNAYVQAAKMARRRVRERARNRSTPA